MTYSELTAAIWDGRQITITGDSGRTVTVVPLGVQRNTVRQWEVLVEGPDGRDTLFVQFDSH
jgi:hypothetical protein